MSDQSVDQLRLLLDQAGAILGQGGVVMQVDASPVAERVLVGIEADVVVVSDGGETYAHLQGLRGDAEDYGLFVLFRGSCGGLAAG